MDKHPKVSKEAKDSLDCYQKCTMALDFKSWVVPL